MTLYELYALVLHVPDLGLGQQDASVEREGHDVRGDLAGVLLRLERHHDLIVRVGDKLEGGEAVRGVEGAHLARHNVLKIRRAAEDQVGAPPLVRHLLVALLAGAAREEEPALQRVAPRCRLVDEVPCGRCAREGIVVKRDATRYKNLTPKSHQKRLR